MTAGLVIRRAGLEDAADVALLLSELNSTVGALGYPDDIARLPRYASLTPAQAEVRLRRAEGTETVLVAYVEGEAAGLTALCLMPYLDQDTPYAEVTQVHVRPGYRRRGIASKLLAAAEDMARQAGATRVNLITAGDNHDAQAFYRAAGYASGGVEFEKYLGGWPTNG